MDTYNIIILIPSTGNRIVIEGAEVMVEMKQDKVNLAVSTYHTNHEVIRSQWLEIDIKVFHPDKPMYNTVRDQLFNEQVYIHFKDAHPNLIRSHLMDMSMMHDNISLKFKGNATDKTYHDFITEVTDQLNAYQYHFSSTSNSDYMQESSTIPKKKRKKSIKRKLTFD